MKRKDRETDGRDARRGVAGKRLYLFITNEIGGVGGGQLYLVQKGMALREAGYMPLVAYFLETPVRIPAVEAFRALYVREMEYPWGALKESQRERGLRKLIDFIESESPEETVIESYSPETAFWGEALCGALKKAGMRSVHLCYLLTENPKVRTESQRRLLESKLERGELRTIAEGNVGILMRRGKDTSADNGEMTVPQMSAGCSPCMHVADCHHPLLGEMTEEECFRILTIGRLDKPCILSIMESVRVFALRRQDLKIEMVLIGDCKSEARRREVTSLGAGVANLRLIAPGYVYPMPREMFRRCDVALGCAASIALCYEEGMDAIVVDTDDGQGIGYLGVTTESLLRRGRGEPPLALDDMLMDVSTGIESRRSERSRGGRKQPTQPDFAPHFGWMQERLSRDDRYGGDCPAEGGDPEIGQKLMKVAPSGRKEKIFRLFMLAGAEKILYLLKKIKQRKFSAKK